MKNPIRPILNYFAASKAELEKVKKKKKKEVVRYSVLVIIVAVATALFFATIDFGLGKVTDFILEKRGITAQPQAVPQTQEIPLENLQGGDVQVETTPVTEPSN